MRIVSKQVFLFVNDTQKFILKNNRQTYLCKDEKTMRHKDGTPFKRKRKFKFYCV